MNSGPYYSNTEFNGSPGETKCGLRQLYNLSPCNPVEVSR